MPWVGQGGVLFPGLSMQNSFSNGSPQLVGCMACFVSLLRSRHPLYQARVSHTTFVFQTETKKARCSFQKISALLLVMLVALIFSLLGLGVGVLDQPFFLLDHKCDQSISLTRSARATMPRPARSDFHSVNLKR